MPYDMTTVGGLQWKAEIRDVYDDRGNAIPREIMRGVYRDDTDECIGRAGPITEVQQHQDVLDPVLQYLHDTGHELHFRTPGRHDLYDLKGHRGAFVDLQQAKTGAIMKFSVIVGDFMQPTGPSQFLPNGPKTMLRTYDGLNSHDSTYAAQVALAYKCVECMNGMVSTDFAATIRGKHTTGFNLEAFQAKIAVGVEMMEGDRERMERYIRSPLSLTQAEEYIKATIAKLKPKADGTPHWSEPLKLDLLERFQNNGGKTVFDMYMAMTEWATHGDIRGGSTELTARVGRDERVARSMRNRQFNELLAA